MKGRYPHLLGNAPELDAGGFEAARSSKSVVVVVVFGAIKPTMVDHPGIVNLR